MILDPLLLVGVMGAPGAGSVVVEELYVMKGSSSDMSGETRFKYQKA